MHHNVPCSLHKYVFYKSSVHVRKQTKSFGHTHTHTQTKCSVHVRPQTLTHAHSVCTHCCVGVKHCNGVPKANSGLVAHTESIRIITLVCTVGCVNASQCLCVCVCMREMFEIGWYKMHTHDTCGCAHTARSSANESAEPSPCSPRGGP